MQEQKVNSYLIRVVIAFVIANILFVMIFFSAYSISYLNYKNIRNGNNVIENYLNDSEYYLNSFSCNSTLLLKASENLDEAGFKLNLLETGFGKSDSRVLEQKKIYSQLEYAHFLLINRMNKECNLNFLTLLFFYSNNENLADESDSMGFIVSSFKGRDTNRFMVYSFDSDLNSSLISNLKNEYNVTNVPIVILNEKNKIYARNIDDLLLN